MIHSKKSITSIHISPCFLSVFGQKSAVYEYGDNEYLEGLELYEKEKYGAAREVFDEFLSEQSGFPI